MKVEYVQFKERRARAEYIAGRFGHLLRGKVLDVGCDKAFLRTLLPDTEYVGVDVAGDPDIALNLEELVKLPFEDATFDCVVCSDVLEHLDNLHGVFREIVRVAGKHVIISLPNNWANARKPIEAGKGSVGHYGIPAVPPPDRHKWFFNMMEARDFLSYWEERLPFRIAELFATEKPRPAMVRWIRRMRFPALSRYLNRYAHTLWAVLEKTSTAPQVARKIA